MFAVGKEPAARLDQPWPATPREPDRQAETECDHDVDQDLAEAPLHALVSTCAYQLGFSIAGSVTGAALGPWPMKVAWPRSPHCTQVNWMKYIGGW
jgi:hypothetical protein